MLEDVNRALIEECEMYIVGHKIFVRLKDIPMYFSQKTKDSIRNRYSHSVEVGLGTEYMLNQISRSLGDDVNLNFYHIGKIIGMVHDIGHTAFSHDGEVILDRVIGRESSFLDTPLRFNANLNNFRRIEKYGLFELLPQDIQKYAYASLIKRESELIEYPEYIYLSDMLAESIVLEEKYLASKGIIIKNSTQKTILCQTMDIADENRYRVTDIIDALNIYSKEKLQEILRRGIESEVRVKDVRKYVNLKVDTSIYKRDIHSDKMKIKDLLIGLLGQESHAKTEFQNCMNTLSMAFNRNFTLSGEGRVVPIDHEIEKLRKDFHQIAATYIWGAKKIKNIKKPFNHYFETVANYFMQETFNYDLIDSSTYKKELMTLEKEKIDKKLKRKKELLLLRNFLGGLTNLKTMDLYKKIKLHTFEERHNCKVDKSEKWMKGISIETFEKKLVLYSKRILKETA